MPFRTREIVLFYTRWLCRNRPARHSPFCPDGVRDRNETGPERIRRLFPTTT